MDFYFSDKLIRIGGIILIDDALHKGVEKFIKYRDTNWPSYKKINCYKTQACYQKLKEDTRDWDFHKNF
jgi:hypothetical protein